MTTEESRLLALLLLRNSLYWHRNLWFHLYVSTFFVNYFLTTEPRITWTFALLDTEFQAQSPCSLGLLGFFSGLEVSSSGRWPDN
jgi:hypothetical protein